MHIVTYPKLPRMPILELADAFMVNSMGLINSKNRSPHIGNAWSADLPDAERQLTDCLDYLSHVKQRTTLPERPCGTYKIKHEVENWLQHYGCSPYYIYEGILIVALMLRGTLVYSDGSNTVYPAISKYRPGLRKYLEPYPQYQGPPSMRNAIPARTLLPASR